MKQISKNTPQSTVSIVIPTYRRSVDLLRLLQSIQASTLPKKRMEIIVVDNANETALQTSIHLSYPEVLLIQSPTNLYSNGARALGAKHATGTYVFFIDDDNILPKTCIDQLVTAMDAHPKIGIAAPVMTYWKRKEIVWSAGGLITPNVQIVYIAKNQPLAEMKGRDNITTIDYFPNAFMVRREVLAVIPFDTENFVHNWAETDFCLRVKAHGYQLVTITDAVIWHDIDYGGSITRLGLDKTYDQAFSRIVFRKIHRNALRQWIIFWCLVFPVSTLYYLRHFISQHDIRRTALIKAYAIGTINAVRYRPKLLNDDAV